MGKPLALPGRLPKFDNYGNNHKIPEEDDPPPKNRRAN